MIPLVHTIFNSVARTSRCETIEPHVSETEFLSYVSNLRSFSKVGMSRNPRQVEIRIGTERTISIYAHVLMLADSKRTPAHWLGAGPQTDDEPITFYEWLSGIYPWIGVKTVFSKPKLVQERELIEKFVDFYRRLDEGLGRAFLSVGIEESQEVETLLDIRPFDQYNIVDDLTRRWKLARGSAGDLIAMKIVGHQTFHKYGPPCMELLDKWNREYFKRVDLDAMEQRCAAEMVVYDSKVENTPLVVTAIQRRFREVLDGELYRRGVQVGDRMLYAGFPK